MNILLISQYFYPEKFLINDVITELSKTNSIIILTGKPNYPFGSIYDGFKCLSIDISNFGKAKLIRIPIIPRKRGFFFLTINYLSFILSSLIFLPFLIRKKQIDIIFSYGVSPPFQSLGVIILNYFFYRKPFVTWVQDLWPASFIVSTGINNRFFNIVINFLNKFIYSKNTLIMNQSQKFELFIKQYSPNVPQYYLPNPAPNEFTLSKYSHSKCNKKSKQFFTILYAGNIGKFQSLDVLLNSARILKEINSNIQIHIYGSGSYFNKIKQLKEDLKLNNVFIFSQVNLIEMRNIMLESDVLYLSLINDPTINFIIPSKLQAYMSIGKPIIGSVTGEAKRVIYEAKCGVAIDPGDSYKLFEVILSMSNLGEENLLQMGSSGLEYYNNNFSMNYVIKEINRLLVIAFNTK
jgi:glycosyltransferase involved in cell wall biosynthesis